MSSEPSLQTVRQHMHDRENCMDPQLKTFIDHCRECLNSQPGAAGRNAVAQRLQVLLSDPSFIDRIIPPQTGERELLYEDPDLGFCVDRKSTRLNSSH